MNSSNYCLLISFAAIAVICCLPLRLSRHLGKDKPTQCDVAREFPHLGNLHGMCTELHKVCVDQNIFVLFSEEDDPRSPHHVKRERMKFDNLHIDMYGYPDAYGTQIKYPEPILRPATRGEETEDLRHPTFSTCTTPVVWYINYLYIFGEFYMRTATSLYVMEQKGWVDRNMTMVLPALNMDLEDYHRMWLQPFTQHNITTLSHMSSRLPRETRETYTVEGTHERCFQHLYICSMQWLQTWDHPRPFFSTAHHIMKYYEAQLPPPADPSYLDPKALKIMFIDRPRTNTRNILNLRQLMQWCRNLSTTLLQDLHSPYNSTVCLVHRPGRMLQDMSLIRHFDIAVGLHGSGLFNAFFMPQHSSIIEVRPTQFHGGWPNQYIRDMSIRDDKDALFWWGINTVTRQLCTPGVMESSGKGPPATWPRDRNCRISIPALEHVVRQILEVNKSVEAYHAKVAGLQYYFTDTVEPLNHTDR